MSLYVTSIRRLSIPQIWKYWTFLFVPSHFFFVILHPSIIFFVQFNFLKISHAIFIPKIVSNQPTHISWEPREYHSKKGAIWNRFLRHHHRHHYLAYGYGRGGKSNRNTQGRRRRRHQRINGQPLGTAAPASMRCTARWTCCIISDVADGWICTLRFEEGMICEIY